MLAKAVANQTDATFIKMAGSERVWKFLDEAAVIFIDEIDAIASKRTDSKTSGDDEEGHETIFKTHTRDMNVSDDDETSSLNAPVHADPKPLLRPSLWLLHESVAKRQMIAK